ncbi:MAG: hypothetical protein DMG09_28135 [Acidobacteria bacterium]|nr:MAG: hypothetical protein DMG09_28135 [Acidobacteriota bacterium]
MTAAPGPVGFSLLSMRISAESAEAASGAWPSGSGADSASIASRPRRRVRLRLLPVREHSGTSGGKVAWHPPIWVSRFDRDQPGVNRGASRLYRKPGSARHRLLRGFSPRFKPQSGDTEKIFFSVSPWLWGLVPR